MLHILFDCRFATACRDRAELRYNMILVESASRWLLDSITMEIKEIVEKIAMVMWSIWFTKKRKI